MAAFLLTPGADNAILDLNPGGTGIKTFNKAIEGLSNKFDGKAESLATFLVSVNDQADTFGWRAQLTIPSGAPPVDRDLIRDYGSITLEEVQTHALTWAGTNTRAAQNAYMMYMFIMNSLTPEFKTKTILQPDKYHVGAARVKDGPSLLKHVISKTYVDTRAATTEIRTSLISMPDKMVTLGYGLQYQGTK